MFFTGLPDADRLILMEIEDKELFSICLPRQKGDIYNKYAIKLATEDFWRNRLVKYFPFTFQYKPENLSWKSYYRSTAFYISEMLKFSLSFDAVKYPDNPKTQYEFFKKHNCKDSDNLLRLSAWEGHLSIVKYLVEKGADVHFKSEYSLLVACGNGHLEVVKYLVEKGADIHVHNEYSLRLACGGGDLSVVKYLVEKGADIHVNDEALKYALENGHLHIAAYLNAL